MPGKNKAPEMTNRTSETENGVITSVENQDAIVELSIQEACQSCGARMVCVPDSAGKRQLKAANPLEARVGDRVAITEKSNFLLTVSFLQYGIPFLGFLTGIFSFYFIDLEAIPLPLELMWFIGGLIGLALGAFISRYYIEKLAEAGGSFFTISKILNSA